MDSRVLIVDENPSVCRAGKCGYLAGLLKRSLQINCAIARDGDLAAASDAAPDLIILRAATAAEHVVHSIASWKSRWRRAQLLTIFCSDPNENLAIPPLLGCDDFSYCPFHEAELLNRVRRLLKTAAGDDKSADAKTAIHFGVLVGTSEKFLDAIKDIPPLGYSDETLLICGETGTGKELFSRAIHYQSPRQGKPFIPVNCAALPDHLFENELFGHNRGAYTDAVSAEKGLVAEAEGGTLLLDEIDSLSLTSQAKLLRFLQDGEYRPLGATRSSTANVRIIASTNSELLNKVRAKQFRADLYYRLNSMSIVIPPLRERIEDVLHLTQHFIADFAAHHQQSSRAISDNALRRLLTYSWPGNVRELKGVISRALVLTSSASLQAQDIVLPNGHVEGGADNASLRQIKSKVVHTFERNYLIGLLAAHRGNISQAAKAAGKQRRTFQRLLFKYSINRHSFQH
jgi:DNA-binding NtrC family response regulator